MSIYSFIITGLTNTISTMSSKQIRPDFMTPFPKHFTPSHADDTSAYFQEAADSAIADFRENIQLLFASMDFDDAINALLLAGKK